MNFEKEKETILKIQKAQRNWDYSKTIPKEHIDHLLWVAKNSPSKQHEAYYDVHWTADREVIKDLYKWTWGRTWGNTQNGRPPSMFRNSQVNASMYIVFVCKEPPTKLNSQVDGSPVPNNYLDRWENSFASIGIAIGLILKTAAELGYATGCNKSHNTGVDLDYPWEKRLGIYDDVKNDKKFILYGVGIGFAQENRPRWESDDYELAIGSSNGNCFSGNKHLNEKQREVKIVDIRSSDKATDPYGNVHELPDKSMTWTNSNRERDIQIKEIK
jgi:nitroreductase